MRVSMEEGYIFYDRLKSHDSFYANYWHKLYDIGLQQYNGLVDINMSEDNLKKQGEKLINLGKQEQQKEIALINEIYGAGIGQSLELEDYPDFINTFNTFIGLKDNYKTFITALNNVNKNKTNPAPIIASYFDEKIRKALIKLINTPEAENIIIENNYEAWENFIRINLENIIEEALIDLSNQEGIGYQKNPDLKIWGKISNILYNESQKNFFMSKVIGLYHLYDSIQPLWALKLEELNGIEKKKQDYQKILKQSMKVVKGRGAKAGKINENFIVALAQDSFNTGKTLRNEKILTDNIYLYSTKTELNLQPFLDELDKSLIGKSLEENRQYFNNFYDKVISKLDDTFIIYESAKGYKFSTIQNEEFGLGFSKSGGFNQLSDIAKKINKQKEIENLLIALKNSVKGAIGEKNSSDVLEKIRFTISEAIAYFLFDDWKQLGNSNNRSIHMFNINHINIPLSYLLIAAGQAMKKSLQDSRTYFDISFTNPKFESLNNKTPNTGILYPEPLTKEIRNGKSIYHFWNLQREEINKNNTYRINFLKNFIDLVSQLAINLS